MIAMPPMLAAEFTAMPVMIVALLVLAIAYRFYSAFLASKVACLDGNRITPAHTMDDGQNYHPTNKWVLFGHHFAAISGAGPLIGPVLAIQFGFAPGLLWILAGVCLAGAVQDMLVLAASVRHNGKSLAEIAKAQLGGFTGGVVSVAILFIVIVALAGLGVVVVKALGGETSKFPPGAALEIATGTKPDMQDAPAVVGIPAGATLVMKDGQRKPYVEAFPIRIAGAEAAAAFARDAEAGKPATIPEGTVRLVKGSSWGTFTIACTIPIALFVGLYMYVLRKGAVVEASIIGGVLTLGATWLGAFIPGSALEPWFDLTGRQVTIAIAVYGFVASVLPVWLLLCPRDYLSSFLKIGTIAVLVVGVIIANPVLHAPAINSVFADGGPTFPQGGLFPFVFICIMCGAVSGFHSLVSSGTTPKMIGNEKDIRLIGYGSMLIEGLVGITALIAAASLPVRDYYDINIDLDKAPAYEKQVNEIIALHESAAVNAHSGRLAEIEKEVQEDLRGRTGGAVTLAVGVAEIFDQALGRLGGLLKYWYHFAIMFEALFILTTIDTGTRIARFLLQETLGKVYAPMARTEWLPGAIFTTAVVTIGWAGLIWFGSVATIWPMFGIANQLLAVIALATVTTWLVNTGRKQYMWVTLAPMCFVVCTTMTAGVQLIFNDRPTSFFPMIQAGLKSENNAMVIQGVLNAALTTGLMGCVIIVLVAGARRWFGGSTETAPHAGKTS